MKRTVQWIVGTMCISTIVVVILVFSFRETILVEAGNFMAPVSNQIEGVVDVAILNGTSFISRRMVGKGMELVSSRKARRLVIVLHRIASHHRPFGLNEDYPSLVRRELQAFGLKDSDATVIVTPSLEPVTLTSARSALKTLSEDGVKSAILVSPGFHMRRSYLVYHYLATPLNIKIYPDAFGHDVNNWWNEMNGPRDFLSEIVKLTFYMAKGYIPLKFSYKSKRTKTCLHPFSS